MIEVGKATDENLIEKWKKQMILKQKKPGEKGQPEKRNENLNLKISVRLLC